jgi:hypothetical protein
MGYIVINFPYVNLKNIDIKQTFLIQERNVNLKSRNYK